MWPETLASEVSTAGGAPVTSTTVAGAPSSRATSRLLVWLTSRRMPLISEVLKPGRLTETSKVDGGSDVIRKYPASEVTASRVVRVSTLVTTTVAPGTTRPEGSLTVPSMALVNCAQRGEAKNTRVANKLGQVLLSTPIRGPPSKKIRRRVKHLGLSPDTSPGLRQNAQISIN